MHSLQSTNCEIMKIYEKLKLTLALDESKKNGQDEYLHDVLSPDVLRQLLVVCPTPKE